MKRNLLSLLAIIICSNLFAQPTQGRIIYERTTQLRIQISNDDPAFSNMIPKERKDRFELLFANNQTLWRSLPDITEGDDMYFTTEGGAQIRMVMPGADDITFTDIPNMRRVEYKELAGKNFIVTDTVNRYDWKLSDETKDILGHNCRKATTVRMQPSMRINNDNGKITREEIIDTLNITAWFAPDLPVFAGPLYYQGQLPGTILEVSEADGRTTFKAVEIGEKVDVKDIKEPKGGKKITAEAFRKEREAMFREMQENGGGNMNIRIRN
ncbi:MAG: GLPGLI family protein [Terrimonas sp.]|nr:GLPGLI family protein [Terrimonas sp.]